MHLVALPTVALFMLVLLVITLEVLTLLLVGLGGLLMETRKTHRRKRLVATVMVLSRRGRCRRPCSCC